MRVLRFASLTVAAGLAWSVLSSSAMADTVTYVITSDHSSEQQVTGGSLPNTGLQLQVDTIAATTQSGITPGTIGLQITALFAPDWGFLTVGGDEATLAWAMPNSTLNFFAVNPTPFSATAWEPVGVGPAVDLTNSVSGANSTPGIGLLGNVQVGGFPDSSSYGYGLLWTQTGGSNYTSTLVFQIFAGDGTSDLTLASLIAGLYQCGGPDCSTPTAFPGVFLADVRNAQGLTGVVDLAPIPIPPAAWLFGAALVGLGVLGRRRRKEGLANA